MRILLIAPPWLEIYGHYKKAAKIGCVSPPLGLAYLGGAIQDTGHDCKVFDMESQQLSASDIVEEIARYDPQLIGITATSPVYNNSKYLAGVIKEHFPDIPLGIGGVHSTIVGKEILEECPDFDFQVVGEGEKAIQEIIESIDSGVKSLEGIKGVIFRKNNTIIENAKRPLCENLDELPKPARQLLDKKLYQHYLPGKGFVNYASIFTSRGCPFQCIFCSQHTMYGRRVRWHSIDRVISELKDITENFQVEHVIIMDETMTLKKSRMLELCQAIKKAGLEFTWEGWTHASTIDEELLVAMKGAGLIRLSFGIESGDAEILKKIKKGVTLEQIRDAYKLAHKVGIETRGSAMLGHPYETRKTAWNTIKFIRSIGECQQMFLNVACPYPGTELYEYAVSGRGGMRLLTADYSKYKRYGDPVITVNDLSANALKRLQTIGLLYFYLTGNRIWYNLVKRAGLKAGVTNAIAFLHGALRGLVTIKRSK